MLIRTLVLGLTCFVLPAIATAQTRVPDEGMGAFGGDVGLFIPPDDDLDAGATFAGFLVLSDAPRGRARHGRGGERRCQRH